ncbi:MAG: PLP-dependent aminotransferase family protein [Oceanospirillaceae bacterium]|nr:PLP-dependent aminotransferase family protein [Oceanospirillaceae bacterium]
MTLYEQLVQQISLQIEQGIYKSGDKLPSIRRLSRLSGVSVATVQKAYAVLEDRRIIEPRPKSGFFVKARDKVPLKKPVQPLGLPNDVAIHALATTIFHACEMPGMVNFGTAYPSIEFLPLKQLQRIMRKLIQVDMEDLLTAHFSAGHRPLKHQVSRRLAETGCLVAEDEVIITNGCQEALILCLRAVAVPGDTIAIESPAFVGLLQAIESLGLKALEIPSDADDGISLEAMALALEQWKIAAVALVPAFNNPSGSNMGQQNKQKLVKLLAAHQVPLIEDDLFGDLSHSTARNIPAKAFDEQGLVLYCSSISKSIAPGFRVGWVCPGKYFKEIEYLKSFTNVSASSMAQAAAAEFLSTGAYDRHIRQLCRIYMQHIDWFQKKIMLHFPVGTSVSQPRGGYILWVELPIGCDTNVIFEAAIKQQVSFLPGQLFSSTGKYNNCLRINCSVSIDERTEQAIQCLGKIAAINLQECVV